ncbi:hypothetical protein TNCV_713481 [Trichonephila clavipes]|nr:hypothetical protein TNCV_713481 [Trichonephila clavipes]
MSSVTLGEEGKCGHHDPEVPSDLFLFPFSPSLHFYPFPVFLPLVVILEARTPLQKLEPLTLMLLASIGDESPMCLPCVETRVLGKEGPGN